MDSNGIFLRLIEAFTTQRLELQKVYECTGCTGCEYRTCPLAGAFRWQALLQGKEREPIGNAEIDLATLRPQGHA